MEFFLSLLPKIAEGALSLIAGPVFLAIWTNLKKYWKYYVLGLSVLLNFGLSYGWHKCHDDLTKEVAAHKADVASYKDAQAKAEIKASQVKTQLTQESKVKADEADKNYHTLLAKYKSNLLRYEQQAHQSGGSGPNSNQSDSTTSGSDGSSSGPFVSITVEDANICAVNTARLVAVHNWAVNLPKE